MIALKTGNIAISRKEAIEIYNFKYLNFPEGKNFIRNNDYINNHCLLQRINLVKGKHISFFFFTQSGFLPAFFFINKKKKKQNFFSFSKKNFFIFFFTFT